MPPYVYSSDALREALKLPVEERHRVVTRMAFTEGLKSGLGVGVVCGGVLGGLWYSGRLSSLPLSASAKTMALVVPPVLTFSIVSEQVASRLARPEAFAYAVAGSDSRASSLALHKRLANLVYDHPYRIMVGVGVVGVVGIFRSTASQAELSFSQRIMHTRVLAQFTVLTTLAGLMGFSDYMRRRGRFLEPWEEAALAAESAVADEQQ